jgi:ParG protein
MLTFSPAQEGGEPVKKKDHTSDERRWKRMNLNVEVELHDAFKAATAAQGKNMTDVLLEYIEQYVEENKVQPLRVRPVPKKGRKQ